MKLENVVALWLMVLAASLAPELAWATEVFKAPTGFLTDVKNFIEGPSGVLLGGAILGVAAIMAAVPRTQVTWGHFGIVLIAICVFYGVFKIAETLQTAYA